MTKRAIGLSLISSIIILTVIGLFYTPYDPAQIVISERLQAPNYAHLFGTDNLGRDVFSRILVGGRWSLFIGSVAVSIGMVVGVLLGAISGYFGKSLDEVLMRIADGLYAFPTILIALLAVTIWGPGHNTVLLAIAIGNIPIFMRLTRVRIVKIKEEPFIEAARAIGASDQRIVFRHLLPNTLGLIFVQASISLAGAILAEASLSYLGVGIQPPLPSWGRMLRDAQSFAGIAPWAVLAPGLFIAIAVLGFNLLGDDISERR